MWEGCVGVCEGSGGVCVRGVWRRMCVREV